VTGPAIATGRGPRPVIAADFNGDGKLDLAAGSTLDGTVTVALGHGDGTFSVFSPIALGTGYPLASMRAADFNQDGKLDLTVAVAGNTEALVVLGKGDGTFTLPAISVPAGNTPDAIAAADFDGDGMPDLGIANQLAGTMTVGINSLNTSATATLAGVKITGPGSHTIDASYPASAVFAASTSNALVLPPTQ